MTIRSYEKKIKGGAISKLMQTNINPFQAATHCNTCVIKSVYFGCGILELSSKQEDELKKIYEEPLLIKLGLSRKFPRAVLCSRKSTLGDGIMTPKTTIDVLKAKTYLGNIRKRGETNKAIANQQELMMVEAGREISIGCDSIERHWHKTWIDEVSDMFYDRGMQITIDKKENK